MKAKRGIINIAIFSILIALTSSCAHHVVIQQPPPPPVVVAPVAPYPGAVWIASEWRWDQKSRVYVKVPGYWSRPPRTQYHWTPGHWNRQRSGYVWIHGNWRR
ncbi:MAG: YXWGXW repeat-containing protein [Chitinophagales bacterium]|nr:YXWGXW repeat-containing protein [Chitinophagales bacterium]